MNSDAVVDAKGMRCPRPIVEMAKAMKKLSPGQVLELLATDAVAKKDVPAWCRTTGHQFLGEEEGEGVFKFYVKKGG